MITKESILELQNQAHPVSVSIYIPTHRSEPEVQQDPIRYKNVLAEVEKELAVKDVAQADIDAIMEKARSLLDDPHFWRHNDNGLALFLTPDFFEHYKLPISFEERFLVDEYFLISPLIRMISLEGSFCVLAVSQKNVRLLKCTRNSTEQISLSEAPESMDDFRRFDLYQKSVQQHSGQGQGTPIFHGHGGGDDDNKVLLDYLKTIENEVTKEMNKRMDPLVIAGVENAVAHYRKVNNYPRLMDESVTKNPDPLSDKELRDHAWEYIEAYYLKDMFEDLKRLGDLTGSDKVSDDLSTIVEDAFYGKIDCLFIPAGSEKWGTFEPELSDTGEEGLITPKHTDLLNLAAMYTLKKGGDVYTVTDHDHLDSEVAAIYRYA